MSIFKPTCPLTHAMARESPAFAENKKNHFQSKNLQISEETKIRIMILIKKFNFNFIKFC